MKLLSPIVVMLLNLIRIRYYMILVSYHSFERCYVLRCQLAKSGVSSYFHSAEARSCKAMEHLYFQF